MPGGAHAATAAPALPRSFGSIQALRFIAALAVVVTHSGLYASDRLVPGADFWLDGAHGVNLFFVISGCVMMLSSQSLRTRVGGWRIFAEKRLVRILPMYWIATTLKLVVFLAVPSAIVHSRPTVGHIVASYFFIPTVNAQGLFQPFLGVGWTLYFEMLFYALFTLALLLRLNLYWSVGIVLAAFTALQPLNHPGGSPWLMFFNGIVLQFFFGMLVAGALQKAWLRAWGVRHPFLVGAVVLAGLVVLFVPFDPWWLPFTLRTGVPSALVVLGACLLEPLFHGRVPRWLLLMGDASYSLYLTHPIVAPMVPEVLDRLGLRSMAVSIVLSVLAAIVAAVVVYKLFESPITGYLNGKIRAHQARQQAADTQPGTGQSAAAQTPIAPLPERFRRTALFGLFGQFGLSRRRAGSAGGTEGPDAGGLAHQGGDVGR